MLKSDGSVEGSAAQARSRSAALEDLGFRA